MWCFVLTPESWRIHVYMICVVNINSHAFHGLVCYDSLEITCCLNTCCSVCVGLPAFLEQQNIESTYMLGIMIGVFIYDHNNSEYEITDLYYICIVSI